jgi:hypothetical protein
VVVDAADRSFFMAVYMAAKRSGVNAQTPGQTATSKNVAETSVLPPWARRCTDQGAAAPLRSMMPRSTKFAASWAVMF